MTHARSSPQAAESSEVDPVPDDHYLARVIAVADQPLPDGFGIDQDDVRQAACHSLCASLVRRQEGASVSDRCHDDGSADESGGRDGKAVSVEVIAVDDLDPVPSQVAGEPDLLSEGMNAIEPANGVVGDGYPARLDLR